MYFPPMRTALLSNPEIYDTLALDCLLCTERMTIIGDGLPAKLVGREDDPDVIDLRARERPTDAEGRVATVMPCGHIFCKKCIDLVCYPAGLRFLASHRLKCPTCKTSWRHELCSQVCCAAGIPFPARFPERGSGHLFALERFPLTIPEGFPGAVLPMCNKCILLRHMVGAAGASTVDLTLIRAHMASQPWGGPILDEGKAALLVV
ncbi:hypothetical protein C8035_v010288 [Colletotrichum spinosum]|uniref:RING-type domain-containing protein n=1 Tax=Colletotrichum spinosum TaxID=1347390 RepID=A0A4V3HS84_9PEZI|nr:hypothetical protein C8035_v010288 [Colletotrichum spinosum]